MIKYALVCSKAHEFESWFCDSDGFDAQKARGLVTCPHCGDSAVSKQIMAPRLARADKDEAPALPVVSPQEAELRGLLKKMRDHLSATAEDVGDKFAEVARQMHYDEVEKRSIYGKADMEEAKALHEEGVEFHLLPFFGDGN